MRICLLLVIVNLGAVVVGRSQPVPRSIAQLRLMDCLPPCWVGIIPGVTTIADAKAKIVSAFVQGSGRTIRDPGFGDAYTSANTVENRIEGDDFSLTVRLNFADLVDGESEIVQSIDLFQPSGAAHMPTVAEILGAFGPPEGVVVDSFATVGVQISLRYSGLDATFHTGMNRDLLDENTHIYLQNPVTQTFSRLWVGFQTLNLDS